MKLLYGFLLLLATQLTSEARSSTAVTVTVLDRGEPFNSMIFHGDTLWVGRNRKNFGSDFSVDAFSSHGEKLDSVVLPHSITSMKVFSPTQVIFGGIDPTRQATSYTIAEIAHGKILAKTMPIPAEGFATFWAANYGGRNYFVDIGGNPNDEELGVPPQTFFTISGSSVRFLPARLVMPIEATLFKNQFVVISRQGLGVDGSHISLVDPKTNVVTKLTPQPLQRLQGLEKITGQDLFVTAESGANRLLVFNPQSGEVVREFRTKGHTRSVAVAGHCVVSGSSETNLVEFFDLRKDIDVATFALEVNLPATDFWGIRKIAVNAATGQTFAQSSYPCNPMLESCQTDLNRVVTWSQEESDIVKKSCL